MLNTQFLNQRHTFTQPPPRCDEETDDPVSKSAWYLSIQVARLTAFTAVERAVRLAGVPEAPARACLPLALDVDSVYALPDSSSLLSEVLSLSLRSMLSSSASSPLAACGIIPVLRRLLAPVERRLGDMLIDEFSASTKCPGCTLAWDGCVTWDASSLRACSLQANQPGDNHVSATQI